MRGRAGRMHCARAMTHLNPLPQLLRQLCVDGSSSMTFPALMMPLEMCGIIRCLPCRVQRISDASVASPDSGSASPLLSEAAAHRQQREIESRTAQCMCTVKCVPT